MFTGIIEALGKVCALSRKGTGLSITISGPDWISSTKVGESISVDGVCLTATDISKNTFQADISAETLKKSTFSKFSSGQKVNLERALKLEDRLNGHIVQGHIDGMGEIRKKQIDKDSGYIFFSYPKHIRKFIVPKGSIAVDGISLTVAEIKDDQFSVSIIPQTFQDTTLLSKNVGDKVNLEADILGKYQMSHLENSNKERVDMDLLKRTGFIK